MLRVSVTVVLSDVSECLAIVRVLKGSFAQISQFAWISQVC